MKTPVITRVADDRRNARSPFAALPLALTLIFASAPLARAQQAAPSTQAGEASTPGAQAPEKKQEEADSNEAYKHSSVVKAIGSKLGMNTDQDTSNCQS